MRSLTALLLVAVLLLTGCQEREKQRQSVADVAATIYEAAKAGENGADIAQVLHAIKLCAHGLIHSQGRKYDPADQWVSSLQPAPKDAP